MNTPSLHTALADLVHDLEDLANEFAICREILDSSYGKAAKVALKSNPAKPQIVITVEGGIIQDVSANTPVDYMTIDYDNDGSDRNQVRVPQSRGGSEDAVAHDCECGNESREHKRVEKLVGNIHKQLNETKQVS